VDTNYIKILSDIGPRVRTRITSRCSRPESQNQTWFSNQAWFSIPYAQKAKQSNGYNPELVHEPYNTYVTHATCALRHTTP